MSRTDINDKDVSLLAPSIQIWQSGEFNYVHRSAKKLSAIKRGELTAIAEKLEIPVNQSKFSLAKAILHSVVNGAE